MYLAPRAANHFIRTLALVALGLTGLGIAPLRQAAADAQPALADLSLEELTNLKVTSVNKKTERASDAAAAVFVITQDDIRRSGARFLPQALRLVPGLQVAQIDGNKWAISARGFNSRFANRLLVLMDGRTLYTLTFGGVFWDAQDTLIEDIERIEVIRGPGGAMWGANAFNGVINIITKHASQTDGTLLTAQTGMQQPFHVGARIGDATGDLQWRAFAKAFEQEPNLDWQEQEGEDHWLQARIGGRIDWQLSSADTLQITSEAYRGESGMELWNYDSLPLPETLPARDEYSGAFAALDWRRSFENGGALTLRGIADYTDRDSVIFGERRITYDVELQHTPAVWNGHALQWGLGARYTADSTRRTTITVEPSDASLAIFNGFAQDEMAFFNDALHVTIGAKIEHSDYIGTQFMPNMRARYQLGANTVLWTAVSRGVRSGSRLERDVLADDIIPLVPNFIPGAAPYSFEVWGDRDFKPEKLNAFEWGWRQQIGDQLAFDLAAYYNQYSQMRGVRRLPTLCAPSMTPVSANPSCIFTATHISVPIQFTNLLDGNIRGAEATVTWTPLRYWRLIGSYAHLDQRMQNNPVSFAGFDIDFADFSAGLDARNQWTLRSSLSIGTQWDWDVLVRRVGELPAAEVSAYTEVNTRLAWRPRIDFEVALVGENLLDSAHYEYVSDFLELAPTSIERSAYVQVSWSF